jgi:hypothetical protein
MMKAAEIKETFDRIRQEMASIDPIAPLTPADQELARLARVYRRASESERGIIRSLVPAKDSPLFWVLTVRAAELALWDADPAHLEDAVTGHCIEDFKTDPRENLMTFALIWYSTEQLKTSPVQLFARAAAMASPRGREFLVECIASPSPVLTGG